MYSVTDINKEVVIGYVYIDLLHRPEKYPHVASFCLVPGCLNEDGVRQKGLYDCICYSVSTVYCCSGFK